MPELPSDSSDNGSPSRGRRKRLLIASTYLMLRKQRRYLPRVVQSIVGVLLILMGIVGFLPILGFWMIPLGLGLIATDYPPLGRWLRAWLRKKSLGIGAGD